MREENRIVNKKIGMKSFLEFERLSTKIEIEDENVITGW